MILINTDSFQKQWWSLDVKNRKETKLLSAKDQIKRAFMKTAKFNRKSKRAFWHNNEYKTENIIIYLLLLLLKAVNRSRSYSNKE